jgi:uncharacterized protein YjbI with pentapeptide repeats
MGAENPTGAKGPRGMKKALEWLGPHLPGAFLELLVFALVALPATFFLEDRIAGRQQEQAEILASTAEVQENIRFARELSIQNGGTKPMNGINLNGANLRGLELGCRTHETSSEDKHHCKDGWFAQDAARLIEANLVGADLSFTNLIGAILVQADLSGATIARTSLHSADLKGARLVDAYLSAPKDIDPFDIGYPPTNRGAYLDNAILNNANMTGANLKFARLIDTHLREAKLVGANLTVANLSGADFTEADLSGADLSGAIIHHTTFNDICFNDQTRWPESIPRPSNPNGCKG